MRSATTGIQGLDAHLGGGIPTGSSVLIISEPSNAPYIFCEQFAAGGLNAQDKVFYYNLERPKSEVFENIRKMVLNPASMGGLEYLDCYSVKLRDLAPPALKVLGIENHSVKVHQDVVPRLLKQPKTAPFRVVIESLNEAIAAYGVEPVLSMVNAITGVVKSLDGVALLMMIRGLQDPAVEMRLKHMVDSVIEFGLERQGFGLYSFISITKMRGVNDATRLLLYKETDKGLWLESTRRVF